MYCGNHCTITEQGKGNRQVAAYLFIVVSTCNTSRFLIYIYSFLCLIGVICSTAKYKFDVFHYFTSLSNKDLLKSLNLNEGPRLHGSNPSEPCYEFAGREGLKVRDLDVVENIRNTSCSTNEITIYASVFFLKTDLGGTVIELTSSNKTFLGLSVCRISNEIYLTYRHLGRLVFETFPFQAKTGK